MKKIKNSPSAGTETTLDGQSNRMLDIGNDDMLLARCRKGNMVAFGQLIEKYQDRLYNAILRMVGNHDDALELTQDAFFRAIQGLKKFRGNSSFYTWLFRIAMNLAINHCSRRSKVKFASIDQTDGSMDTQADKLLAVMGHVDNNRPETKVMLRENYGRALAALQQLEGHGRAVVILRDIEGLSYSEIAKILEIPAGTVKSKLARSRSQLRKLLAE
ncbi:MAG: sigma-70 family RNA polymerase sigma factor [Phycisphaerae bacterium]|nr:sigma-70 family RNA polymerase sigma factor [Phycisphaerae bacterium]